MNNELEKIRQFYFDRLFGESIPFWLKHAVDWELGGYWTSLDRDGAVVDTDKIAWQQGRFTWLLAELFNDPRFGKHAEAPSWLEAAGQGARFMRDHGFDPQDGRMWFHLDRQGNPIRKRRYAFSESFAAIAFGELSQANGNDQDRELAIACFEEFRNHGQNPKHVEPKFTGTRRMKSIGLPMISIGTAQELRDSIGLDNAEAIIDSAIGEIESLFVKPELECVMETVADNGDVIDHFEGRTLNPGHAIEAAWFVMEEGRVRNYASYIELGCQMLDWMFDRGWDDEYGGLLYFTDLRGLPVQEYWHDMKFWWPHNETLVASLLAYSLTRNPKYLEMHSQVHQWSFQHFQDDQYGEWFGYLHRDGRLSHSLKGNHWKGPFHYPRMLLKSIRILDSMLQESRF